MRHVIFRVEKERYALPLSSVREIVSPGKLALIPRAPDAARGIMNLRGRVVTVMDLKVLLGLGPAEPVGEEPPPGQVILLDRGRRDLGLLVAEVEAIQPVEQVGPAPGSGSPAVKGVARLGDRAVTVLDPDGLDGQVISLFGGQAAP